MIATEVILKLLGDRSAGATVCPSEAARALALKGGGQNWRDFMLPVHAAVDQLVSQGRIQLSWKGRQMTHRAGPYRIGPSG